MDLINSNFSLRFLSRCFVVFGCFYHFFFGRHEVAQLCTWRGGSDLSNDVIISIPWTFHSFASHVPAGVWGERTYLLHTSTYLARTCAQTYFIYCTYMCTLYYIIMFRCRGAISGNFSTAFVVSELDFPVQLHSLLSKGIRKYSLRHLFRK